MCVLRPILWGYIRDNVDNKSKTKQKEERKLNETYTRIQRTKQYNTRRDTYISIIIINYYNYKYVFFTL